MTEPLIEVVQEVPEELQITPEQEKLAFDSIRIEFETEQDLLNFVKKLRYFDKYLNINEAAWNGLNPNQATAQDVVDAHQEFWVVTRLLTIQRYQSAPEVSRDFLKNKLTGNDLYFDSPMDRVLGYSKLGSQMTIDEWTQYESVYNTLLVEFQNKLAKHPTKHD